MIYLTGQKEILSILIMLLILSDFFLPSAISGLKNYS